MDAREVLRHLRKAKAPHRNLDIKIGLLVGYERKTEETGDSQEAAYFVDRTGKPTKIPDFTRSLDAAYALADVLLPGNVGAVSWEGDTYKAQIVGGPVCEASDPALALCIAAFISHLGDAIEDDE